MKDENTEGSPGANLTVAVTNENNGKTDQLHAGPGTPVATIIDRMYASPKLGIGTRSGQDRLRCKADGTDVFQYSNMHLGEFTQKYCSGLQWLFAGPTGGA